MPTSVTAWSRPNISRTCVRDTLPSVSIIAARICAVVSTLPTCDATSTMPHVIHPKPGSTPAATWTITIISDVTSANCARLNANLTGDARRSSSATSAPAITAANACVPLVKIRASVSGTSVSENECALRRNSSSTGQRSVTNTMIPSAHHQLTSVPRIGSNCLIHERYSTAAAVPVREISHHTGSMDFSFRPAARRSITGPSASLGEP